MAIHTLPTQQGQVTIPYLDLETLDILWANEFEDETFHPNVARQAEADFYKGAPPRWLNFYWAEKQGSPLLKREGYDELVHLIRRRQEKNWSLSDIQLHHQPGSGGSTLAMQVLWDLRKELRCARLIDLTSDAKAISKDVIRIFSAGGEGKENTVLLLVDNQHLVEENLYKKNVHDNLLGEIQKYPDTNIPTVIILYCSFRDFTRNGTVLLKSTLSPHEKGMFEEYQTNIIERYGNEYDTFHGFQHMLSPCFTDTDTNIEAKTLIEKTLVDVLKFEEDIDTEEAKRIEVDFYKGFSPQWQNFHLAEKFGSPLVKRYGYKKLIQLIQVQSRSKSKTCSIKLLHEARSGGTTLAMQVLWDLRKEFLCAVLKGSCEDTNEIARQIRELLGHEQTKNKTKKKTSKKKNTTILLLVDNGQGKNLSERLNKEFTEKPDIPLAIILHLEHRTTTFEPGVTLLAELLPEEKEMCKKKLEDIRKVHEVDSERFHGVNILLQNFNQNYVKRIVIASEMTNYVKEHKHSQSTKLFAFLALANSYVPGSYLLESLCQDLGLKGDVFSSLIITFPKTTAEHQHEHVRCVRIAHPMIAEECVLSILAAKISRANMCKPFLSSIRRRVRGEYLLQILKIMLTKRTVDETSHDLFSRLVLDITNEGECTDLLEHASNVFTEDPFFPQALARFYYIKLKDYKKAESWAQEAIKREPRNSFIMDTLGQIHKNHLKKKGQEKSTSFRHILGIAESAFNAFQKEEELANQEDDTNMKTFGVTKTSHTFNYRGLFGYIQAADETFRSLQKRDEKWSDVFSQKPTNQQAMHYLFSDKKLLKFKNLVVNLKSNVLKKCHFFDCFLTYSKPSKWEDEPQYVQRDVELCYSKFAGVKGYTRMNASSFAGLLCSLRRNCHFDAMTRMCQQGENKDESEVTDLILAYILSVIILNTTGASAAAASTQGLRAVLEKNMDKHNSPEFYLLSLLLFWPDRNEKQSTGPDLNDLVKKMSQSFEQQWKKQMRSRYLVPLFFIGQGDGLQKIVHQSRLNNSQMKQLISDKSNANIALLRRIEGMVQKPKILAHINGKEIEVMPHSPASVRGNGKVSFYLGFTIRGPVAMCIKTMDYSPKEVTDGRPIYGGMF